MTTYAKKYLIILEKGCIGIKGYKNSITKSIYLNKINIYSYLATGKLKISIIYIYKIPILTVDVQ